MFQEHKVVKLINITLYFNHTPKTPEIPISMAKSLEYSVNYCISNQNRDLLG